MAYGSFCVRLLDEKFDDEENGDAGVGEAENEASEGFVADARAHEVGEVVAEMVFITNKDEREKWGEDDEKAEEEIRRPSGGELDD